MLGDEVRSPRIDASGREGIRERGHHSQCLLPWVVGTDMWLEIDKRFAEITGAPVGETHRSRESRSGGRRRRTTWRLWHTIWPAPNPAT